jgi:O-antigen/teichoic acid export membrane protein
VIAPPGVAARRRGALERFREELRQPLFRNGHALVLSSFATASIGFAYWVLAARGYDPAVVGRSAVALTTLSFVGGIAQCNLASALVRFIPGSGSSLRRFVLACYGFAIAVSVLLALGFFAVLPAVAPSLEFIARDRSLVAWFVVSTAAQAIFVLEDGVLTGLRRATLVPIENAGFSLVKAVLVVAIAGIRPSTGIFLSWTIATLVTIVPTNLYIFIRAIPAHTERHPHGSVSLRDLVRYVPFDYGAWMFWAAATTLLPLVVIADTGAAEEAAFNLAWVITYSLYLVSINLGSSLVVESAADQSDLPAQARQVVVHLAKLIVPASILVAVAAPLIMRIFGHNYSAAGAPTLRLLAISAPPFVLTSTLQSSLRAMRRTRAVLAIDAALCTVAIGLSCLLLPVVGIVATGIGWCVAQYLVAGVLVAKLLARRHELAGAPGMQRLGTTAVTLPGARDAAPSPRRVGQLLAELRPAVTADLAQLWPGVDISAFDLVPVTAPAGSPSSCAGELRAAGYPTAIVHVSCSDIEAETLRHRAAALAALAADERLGTWRDLLPACATDVAGVRVFSVEVLSGGVDAEAVIGGAPFLWRAVARRGLDALAQLHERGRLDEPGETLEELVRSTCERVRRRIQSGPSRPAALLARLDTIERRLVDAVAASSGEPRAWTHGHLMPSLLRVTPEAGLVTGLRGFERARRDGVPALDAAGFLLRTMALVRQRAFADVVAEVCAGGPLHAEAVAALAPALSRSGIDVCELALWSWADEVAGGPGLPARPVVSSGELDPVLDALERAS